MSLCRLSFLEEHGSMCFALPELFPLCGYFGKQSKFQLHRFEKKRKKSAQNCIIPNWRSNFRQKRSIAPLESKKERLSAINVVDHKFSGDCEITSTGFTANIRSADCSKSSSSQSSKSIPMPSLLFLQYNKNQSASVPRNTPSQTHKSNTPSSLKSGEIGQAGFGMSDHCSQRNRRYDEQDSIEKVDECGGSFDNILNDTSSASPIFNVECCPLTTPDCKLSEGSESLDLLLPLCRHLTSEYNFVNYDEQHAEDPSAVYFNFF